MASWWERWAKRWDDGWSSLAADVKARAQAIVDADPIGVKAQGEVAVQQLQKLWDRHQLLQDAADNNLGNFTDAERAALWDTSKQLRVNVLNTIATMEMDPNQVLGVRIDPEIGNPLAVGLVVGVVALAALYVVSSYIEVWDHETEVTEIETLGRIEAMRAGTTLQPATVEKSSSPIDGVAKSVAGAAGALAVGALVLGAAWWAANRAS